MSKRAPTLYLKDILSSIEFIEEFIEGILYDDFASDRKTIDAVVRNLEIIGEAAKNIDKEITNEHPEIPWERMISMRNKVIHEYFGVDTEILWETVTIDLPSLKEKIKNLL